ncbi:MULTISPECIES: type II toxin-antitoxin system RelE family toxin [Hydrogenophaga]|uniref:RelE/StbE family addiction module toxin n=1 Tax=Hydrogenophaga intermedia TaxID=65786 RepID=A0A1L1PHA5_HYDIT|nr:MULTISPECIES: type II toxin-antitoxin system RelE/ParE family toxin [Hydrogenophaga]CDN89402.1 RelE/StbE family addiction module toxin [Hydrogenophaga intermedia]
MAKAKAPLPAPVAAPSPHKYKLKFLPSALDEWKALDGSVKENFRKLLKSRLDNPHVPGAELRGELRGYYKIKLRKQGYRLVYGVEDDALVVMVMAVDKREDSEAYASAIARLQPASKRIAKAGSGDAAPQKHTRPGKRRQ